MYLNGINIKPTTAKEARTLIGKKVEYLKLGDIDKYRGICFPKKNKIVDAKGRNLFFENGDTLYFNDIVEMVIVE